MVGPLSHRRALPHWRVFPSFASIPLNEPAGVLVGHGEPRISRRRWTSRWRPGDLQSAAVMRSRRSTPLDRVRASRAAQPVMFWWPPPRCSSPTKPPRYRGRPEFGEILKNAHNH